jgi:nucleoid-associated protein EbfC
VSGNGGQDFAAFARRMQGMQSALANVQADMAALEATGYGGNGLVAATVTGKGRLVGLRIDSSVIDPDDPETLCDLIIAAVDEATDSMTEQRDRRMSGITEDLHVVADGIRRRTADLESRPKPLRPNRRFDASGGVS